MSLPWGLTTAGFVAKTHEQILAEIEEQQKAQISAELNVKAGPTHQLNGIFSSKVRELWELAAAVDAAGDPDRASGASLDAVSALRGTDREAATKSRVTATVTLGASMTLPAGSIASVDGTPTSRFVTLVDVTSVLAGDYSVAMEAETAGPVAANSGTLTEIETPVSGWSAITNDEDAVLGTVIEVDADLRARSEDELAGAGTSPADAIRADLLDIEGVQTVQVFQNLTLVTDGDGVPGKSVEAVVYDGSDDGSIVSDDAIAQVLWDSVAAGISTHGSSSGTATASDGTEHTMYFSRPSVRPVYVNATLDVALSRGWDTDSGEDLVKGAIVDTGCATFGSGDDVIRRRLEAGAMTIGGVIDLTAFTLGFSASPVGTSNLTISRRELATFDTGRVNLTINLVSPP